MKKHTLYGTIAISSVLALSALANAQHLMSAWPFSAPGVSDRNSIDPKNQGDITFDTTDDKFFGWDGTSWIELGGSDSNSTVSSFNSNDTLALSDDIALGDATSAAFTLTLPSAVGFSGKIIEIKKVDSSLNAITIDGENSETIDGTATKKLFTPKESIRIVSDGSNWEILERSIPSFIGTETWTDSVANATTSVRVFREGSHVIIHGVTSYTGAGGALNVTIPAAYTEDSSYVYTSGKGYHVGEAQMVDASDKRWHGHVTLNGTSSLTLYYTATQSGGIVDGSVSSTQPFTWVSGDSAVFQATWEVSGWKD